MNEEMFVEKFQPPLPAMLGDTYDAYVFIDGRFVKGDEAKISVYDHGLLYGDAVFEGIRTYNGKVFKLDEHLDRLFDSAQALAMEVPLTRGEFEQVIYRLLELNGLQEAHVRPIVTRGSGRLGLDPRRSVRPTVIIIAVPMPPLLGEEPVRVITSGIRRKAPHSIDSKIKSVNYLDSVLAKLQANAVGADDAIFLDLNGFVAEATTENIFVIKKGQIFTPDVVAALEGITRATVMEEAAKLGHPVIVKNITYHELYTADEIFLTGTSAEIVPVKEIDGRIIGDGKVGPITAQLMQAYRKLRGG
jgi:branched-chain amino acid aminotransferase